jgi:hypothetical protein
MAADGEETMDLSASIGDAVQAARRGDVDALERELVRLHSLNADSVGGLGTRLRAMARSAQAHPSYKASPAAQTG